MGRYTKYLATLKYNFSKKKKEIDRKKLQKRLGHVTKIAENCLINHDAYVQADAYARQIPLSKFRKQIKDNLSGESDDSDDDDNDGPKSSSGNDKNVSF